MRFYQISEPINGRRFRATLDDMLAKIIRAVAVTTACAITCGGNARAEILITTAAITRGELTIVGRVGRPREPSVHIKISPNKTVQVESNSTGGFGRGPA